MMAMTDNSDERRSEHELVHALPEGAQKELAEYMIRWSSFPDAPVFDNPTYDDELVALTYRAGGCFYRKGKRLVFHPMSTLELDNWWVDDHLKDPEYEAFIARNYPDAEIFS
jgi:hypothetical protein